tara:strand:+ start:46 stop:1137 length:1092 start_codon:yes stop_codon:yes gene_type:complete
MKILICAESFYPEINGVSSVITNLTREFSKKNIEISIATKKIIKRKKLIIKNEYIKVHEFEISGNYVNGIRGEKKKYTDFLKNSNFDIYFFYAAQQWSFDLALPIIKSFNKKICFVPCGFSRLNNFFYKRYFDFLFNEISNINSVIFHSKYYQDYIVCKDKKIKNLSIITNGANTCLSKDQKKNNDILIISEIKFNKGLDRSLLALLMSDVSNNNLKIYSQKKPHALNFYFLLINFLAFLLKLKKINTTLAYGFDEKYFKNERFKFRIFLFGSRLECSPLVLYESAASGLPFVSFKSGNSEEIAKKTGAGITVNSIIEMTKAINKLFYDNKLNRKLSNAGLKNSLKFTWKKIANKYIQIFRSI